MKIKTTTLILIIMFFVMITLVRASDESIVKIPFRIKWQKQSPTEAVIFIEPVERDTAIEGGGYAKTIIFDDEENCFCSNSTNSTNCTNCSIKGLNEDFVDELTLITTRLFGNYSEVQYNLEQFTKQLNFTKKWEDCVKLNGDLDYIIKTQMINKSEHLSILKNMTKDLDAKESLINEKQDKIRELEDRLRKTQTNRNWGWGLSIFLGIVVLYFLRTYYGWFRKKQHDEEEIPRDVPG